MIKYFVVRAEDIILEACLIFEKIIRVVNLFEKGLVDLYWYSVYLIYEEDGHTSFIIYNATDYYEDILSESVLEDI